MPLRSHYPGEVWVQCSCTTAQRRVVAGTVVSMLYCCMLPGCSPVIVRSLQNGYAPRGAPWPPAAGAVVRSERCLLCITNGLVAKRGSPDFTATLGVVRHGGRVGLR